MNFNEKNYREIITKAVCGTGQQLIKKTDMISAHHLPTSILGCWVINHEYQAEKNGHNEVIVYGNYDVNIWYSFHDNTETEVVTETVEYRDEIPLTKRDEESFNHEEDVLVMVLQQPSCLKCHIDEEDVQISVEIQREFMAEVIGETRVKVRINPDQEFESIDRDVGMDETIANLKREFSHGVRK